MQTSLPLTWSALTRDGRYTHPYATPTPELGLGVPICHELGPRTKLGSQNKPPPNLLPCCAGTEILNSLFLNPLLLAVHRHTQTSFSHAAEAAEEDMVWDRAWKKR